MRVMGDLPERLARRIRPRLTAAAAAHVDELLRTIAGPGGTAAAAEGFPSLSRAVGRAPLIAAFGERAAAVETGPFGPVAVGEWRLDEAVRVLVLLRAAGGVPASAAVTLLRSVYAAGDADERAAVLRALSFLPMGGEAVDLVLDGVRSNHAALIRAALLDNPCASRFLPDLEFRKAVLKAVFLEMPVGRIAGLTDRATPELAQSLCDFIDEREAAQRPVPPEIWPVAALNPRPGLVARLVGRLEHPLPVERLHAALALRAAADPRAASFLAEREGREQDGAVRAAIAAARGALAGTSDRT